MDGYTSMLDYLEDILSKDRVFTNLVINSSIALFLEVDNFFAKKSISDISLIGVHPNLDS
jgi:hypothetical protein